MSNQKRLVVATEIQRAVLQEVLLQEISTGFWKNARPADHADYWKGVEITIGTDLGPHGFQMPRNYNFVNPDFFSKTGDRLLEAAKTVNPDVTVKQLKKQLITLNQILGARLKEIGGSVTKLPRGRKTQPVVTATTQKSSTTVRRAAVNFVETSETEVA